MWTTICNMTTAVRGREYVRGRGNFVITLLLVLMFSAGAVVQQVHAQEMKIGTKVSLQSVNYTLHTVSHQNFRGKILRGRIAGQRDDIFWVRPGQAGTGITFESVRSPGYFLRHRNFEIWLDRSDGTELFRKDATFTVEAGLAGSGVSYHSINYPDHYIRHQNFNLYIQPLEDSDLYRKDTSFRPRTHTGS